MIKKLRIRIVLIILLTCLIIIASMSALYLNSTYSHLSDMNITALEKIMKQPWSTVYRDSEIITTDDFFIVDVSSSGVITAVQMGSYGFAHTDAMQQIVSTASADTNKTGVISDLQLRYMKSKRYDGYRLACISIADTLDTYQSMFRTLMFIDFGSFLMFAILAVILSNVITKPIKQTMDEQKQFVSDVSHDLKTPISVISGCSSMLKETENATDAQRKRWVDSIISETARMKTMTEDLLTMARLESKDTLLNFEKLDLSDLVSGETLRFESSFYEHNISFDSDIGSMLYINGDRKSLESLVSILLDNALKYTVSGGKVSLSLLKNASRVILTVASEGTPLTDEQCERIFTRFSRLDESRSKPGYGLGLPIARSIMEAHDGTITARSDDSFNYFECSFPLLSR